MSEDYKGIKYETINVWQENNIGFIQFNRPKAMNAMNEQLSDECYEASVLFEEDPDIRVVILCGNEHAFAAGADLKAVSQFNPFQARKFLDKVHRNMMFIEDSHKPYIAAVRGLVLGGGLETVLACDLRIIAENTTLGLPEIKVGIFPGGGATQRLPRNTSIALAKQYIFSGDFFDSATAYRLGIANLVVAPEQVMDETRKAAKKLCKKSPLALREAKNAINMSMNTDIKTGCRMEQLAWSMLFSSADQKEGMNAFLEGRKAEFKGF